MSAEEIKEKELREILADSATSYFLEKLVNSEQRSTLTREPGFQNNINLMSGSVNPAYLKNNIFNYGSDASSEAEKDFLQSSNLFLSNLVPYIRIYKIFTVNKKEYPLELPFDDYTGFSDIDNIFRTKVGRGSGLGLISFDWKSMAKNEANIAQFSAELKLMVQDVTELEKIRNSSEGRTVSLLDLIYPQIRESTTDDAQVYDKDALALKMVVGWNPDTPNIPKSGTSSEYIKKYGLTSFYLTLIKHNFEFREDGSVIVTITFIASTELEMNDPINNNCLFSILEAINNKVTRLTKEWKNTIQIVKEEKEDKDEEKRKRQIQKLINLYDDANSQLKKAGNISIKKNSGGISIGGDASTIIKLDDDAEELQQKFDNFVKYTANLIADQKITALRQSLEFFSAKNLIYTLEIDNQELTNLIKIYNTADETILDNSIFETFVSGSKSNTTVSISRDASLSNAEILENIDENSSEENETTTLNVEQFSKDVQEQIREKKRNSPFGLGYLYRLVSAAGRLVSGEEVEQTTDQEYSEFVPYIYLYDILNYFVNTTSFLQNNKIILGNFTYKSYNLNNAQNFKLKKIKVKESENSDGETKDKVVKILELQSRTANIGDIPISLKSYINWFSKNILEKDIKKMSINKFLNLVFKDLVPMNINTKFIKFFPSYKFKASVYPIKVKQKIMDDRPIDFTNSMVPESDFFNLKQYLPVDNKIEENMNLVFILSENEENINLKGDFDQDWNTNGIYHFYVGEEKGLVKRISFNREDNPRLEAAQLQAANPENNGEIIRHVYSSTLELFGNNLFEPGHLIYINPTYPGLGLKNTILFKMGLGGYYRVINVNSFIEPGIYRTELNCKWESFGTEQDTAQAKMLEGDYEGVGLE